MSLLSEDRTGAEITQRTIYWNIFCFFHFPWSSNNNCVQENCVLSFRCEVNLSWNVSSASEGVLILRPIPLNWSNCSPQRRSKPSRLIRSSRVTVLSLLNGDEPISRCCLVIRIGTEATWGLPRRSSAATLYASPRHLLLAACLKIDVAIQCAGNIKQCLETWKSV